MQDNPRWREFYQRFSRQSELYGTTGSILPADLLFRDSIPGGSIDWLCLLHFDSPSVFAAILDDQKGGRFRIAPATLGPIWVRGVAASRGHAETG